MTNQEKDEIAALAKDHAAKEAIYDACRLAQQSEKAAVALHLAHVEMDIARSLLEARKRQAILANTVIV